MLLSLCSIFDKISHSIALQKGTLQDDDLYDLKIDLVKRLVKKNFSKQKIVNILNFIKYYVRFKDDTKGHNFDNDVDLITNKTYPMGTHEILLWQAENKGIEKGREEGIEIFLKNTIQFKLEKGDSIQKIAENLVIDINRVIEIINKFQLSS